MISPNGNGHSDNYETANFREAVFLRVKGAIYVETKWVEKPNNQGNLRESAVFVFKIPSDDILSAWVRGDDGGVRAILEAADFFRDEIKRRNR